MANPSLQIGNSNWAIKEDNLLGYSTAGTRFVPQPITMTRASAGTRVNSSGLVETVELLGSEEIVNGDFATDSDWSGQADIINNEMVFDCAANPNASTYQSKTPAYTLGRTFKVTVTIVSNTTGAALLLYPFSNSPYVDSITIGTIAGTYTFNFVSDYVSGTGKTFVFRVLSSTGTLVIDNVSVKESTKNNLARVDYDGTASSLLVEPERTNIAEYSENFISGNFWGFQSLSKIDNSIISPDGTQNADKLYPSSTGDFRGLTKGFGSSLNAAAYNLSTFVKKGGKDFFFFYNIGSPQGSNGCWFNLSTGVIGTVGSAYTNVKIEDVGNDWFRCSATLNYGGTGDYVYLLMSDYNGSLTASVNGTDGIYLWGTQIEEGSYGTSYIPTDGGTVTRVQDQYSKTGISNLINSEEGVLFAEMAALSDDSTNRQLTLSDGSDTNRIVLKYDNQSNIIQSFNRVSGVETASLSATVSDITQFSKIAIKYKLNDYAMWIDGVEVDTDNSSTTFPSSTLNKLSFGTSSSLFAKVKQLQVFKTALTDDELETLTT